MQYIEFGEENNKTIMLLHGGGLSWWNYKEVANLLKDSYHVILPILDGHANSTNNFTSIEDNANEIIQWINEKYNGSIYIMGGLSLGGQILLEILSQKEDICEYAIIESALIIPSKFTYTCIKPSLHSSYPLIHKMWFAKAQFKSLRIKEDLFEDYYRDTCKITKENMISFLEANSLYSLKENIMNNKAHIHIVAGEKEVKSIIKSAEILHSKLNGTLHILPDLYHGEFSMNYANEYVKLIYNITDIK